MGHGKAAWWLEGNGKGQFQSSVAALLIQGEQLSGKENLATWIRPKKQKEKEKMVEERRFLLAHYSFVWIEHTTIVTLESDERQADSK